MFVLRSGAERRPRRVAEHPVVVVLRRLLGRVVPGRRCGRRAADVHTDQNRYLVRRLLRAVPRKLLLENLVFFITIQLQTEGWARSEDNNNTAAATAKRSYGRRTSTSTT